MGTIFERDRKDGTKAFQAQVLIKRDGKIAHRETKTFDRKQAASAWCEKRERELSKPGAIEAVRADVVTLAMAIDRYIAESRKALGRTKEQVLRSIKRDYAIGGMACDKITSEKIVEFLREIQAQPQTVMNYQSHLSSVFTVAKPAWGYDLDRQAMDDALVVARKLGIVGKPNKRDRRPTLDDVDRLMERFIATKRARPQTNPMAHIMAFAIFSTRRQEEIVRIRWVDLDEDHARVLVRDMKHPGDKVGNDTWVELVPEAMQIVRMMPRVRPEIFPYGTDAISTAFTRACADLEIEDLHFHDLRHDGISRLFEIGWHIAQVAPVSGHRTWDSLKRYTHIRQRGDKYAGWPWLERLASEPIKGRTFRQPQKEIDHESPSRKLRSARNAAVLDG